MIDVTLQFWVIAAIIVFLTGISKSGFAAGFGALGVPILSIFVPPAVAAGLLLPPMLFVDITNLWNYRNHWDKRLVALFLPGALLGIALGSLTFTIVNPDGVRLLVGAIALWFATLHWASPLLPKINRQYGTGVAFVFGAIAGFTSHIAHAGGPPVRAYLLTMKIDKSVFVGTIGYFFCIVNLIKLVPYVVFGQINWITLWASAFLVPFTLLGVVVGIALHKKTSQQLFTQMAYVFLTIAGVKLIADGLTGLL